jgi:hypothetical protein
MTTTVHTRIEPFQEPDEEGVIYDLNRITAEIKVDDEVVWTKTVETNDSIESVCGVRDELGWEAVQHAVANYGYEYDEEEAESYGLLVTTA